MNRLVEHIDLEPFAQLFEDICAWNPRLRAPLLADLARMRKLSDTRGPGFVLSTMPAACKVFDRALSRGHLNPSDLPKEFGLVKGGYREFLGTLMSGVFDSQGNIVPEVDPTNVFFVRSLLCLYKKLVWPCPERNIAAAVVEFFEIEARMRKPTCPWIADEPEFRGHSRHFSDEILDGSSTFLNVDVQPPKPLVRMLQEVCDLLSSKFPALDPLDILPKHGPGAVSDVKSGGDKYTFPCWPAKLERVFPRVAFAQTRPDLHLEVQTNWSCFEFPAKLLAVPKTFDKPRLIASEPVAHQYLQLGMMRWIRDNMPRALRSSINFKSQEPSRVLAKEASIGGEFATVDLSSASDRLSCWVVERAFRCAPALLDALHACRTRWLIDATNSTTEESFTILRKYAPQGNGTTFPVQTMVYTMAAISCVLYEQGSQVTYNSIKDAARNVRVFGDDIIVPSSVVVSLDLLLTYLGLKLNVGKTHYTGNFRESCGMDAFRGYDVTPIYMSYQRPGSTAGELQSWVDVSNNAHSAGLLHLADWMISVVPKGRRSNIPVSSKDLSCLHFRSFVGSQYRSTRFNRDLQRDEVRGLVPQNHQRVDRRDSYLDLLQYFVEAPHPETKWVAGVKGRVRSVLAKRWVPID